MIESRECPAREPPGVDRGAVGAGEKKPPATRLGKANVSGFHSASFRLRLPVGSSVIRYYSLEHESPGDHAKE